MEAVIRGMVLRFLQEHFPDERFDFSDNLMREVREGAAQGVALFAMQRNKGVRIQAAESVGVNRNTLAKLLRGVNGSRRK